MSEYCLSCGYMIEDWDTAYFARSMNCIPCYTRKTMEAPMVSCGKCGLRIKSSEARRKSGGQYCNYCAAELERLERAKKCAVCRLAIESWQKSAKSPSGPIHLSCAGPSTGHPAAILCSHCGEKKREKMRISTFGQPVCSSCSLLEKKGRGHTVLSSFVDRIGAMIG